jgi:hypothetical protein
MKILLAILATACGFFTLRAQNFYMRLSANSESATKVFADEPVLFRLSLSNPAAASDWEWNASAYRRIAEIEDSVKNNSRNSGKYLQEKKEIQQQLKSLDSVKLGTDALPWYESIRWSIENRDGVLAMSLPVKRLPVPQTAPIIILGAEHQYSICYGIDSIGFALLKPGDYLVRARMGKTVSNPVTITVLAQLMPERVVNSPEVLLRFGNYFLQSCNPVKAMEYASRLLRADSVSLSAQVLMADAYYQNMEYVKAAEWYDKAYQGYYKKYGMGAEPPEYLVIMLSLIKQKQ